MVWSILDAYLSSFNFFFSWWDHENLYSMPRYLLLYLCFLSKARGTESKYDMKHVCVISALPLVGNAPLLAGRLGSLAPLVKSIHSISIFIMKIITTLLKPCLLYRIISFMGFFLLCQAWFPSNPVFCCGFHNFPSIESDTQLIYAIIYYIWFFLFFSVKTYFQPYKYYLFWTHRALMVLKNVYSTKKRSRLWCQGTLIA